MRIAFQMLNFSFSKFQLSILSNSKVLFWGWCLPENLQISSDYVLFKYDTSLWVSISTLYVDQFKKFILGGHFGEFFLPKDPLIWSE